MLHFVCSPVIDSIVKQVEIIILLLVESAISFVLYFRDKVKTN